MVSKKEIRKYVFAKRKEMTQEEADSLSISIYEKVISLPEFQEASCIICSQYLGGGPLCAKKQKT